MPLIKYTIYKTISKTIRTINSRGFLFIFNFSKAFQDIYDIFYGKKITQMSDNSPPPYTHP